VLSLNSPSSTAISGHLCPPFPNIRTFSNLDIAQAASISLAPFLDLPDFALLLTALMPATKINVKCDSACRAAEASRKKKQAQETRHTLLANGSYCKPKFIAWRRSACRCPEPRQTCCYFSSEKAPC
jgi:hypothetical protein